MSEPESSRRDSLPFAHRSLWPWIALFLSGLGGILWIFSGKFAIVNADAGYYLSLVAAAARGEVWYRDLFIGYAPLSLYGFRLIRWLSGPETHYEHYLTGILLLHLLNAGLLFVLSGRIISFPWPRLSLAAFYVMLVLTYEGENILLEPLCSTFCLLTLLSLTKEGALWGRVMWSSCWVMLACLCKQYGGLMGLGIAAWLFSQIPQLGWKKSLQGALLSMGVFGGGLLAVALCLGWQYGVRWDWLVLEWMGGIGREYGDFAMLDGLLVWVRNLLISLPVLVFLPKLWSSRKHDPWLWLLVMSFIGLSFPFYVKTFQHYWLLPLPMGLLLVAYVWEYLLGQQLRTLAYVALGTMLAVNTLRAGLQMKFLWKSQGERLEQKRVAARIHRYIPPGTPTLLLPTHAQSLNYLADLRPVDPTLSGFAFPSSFDPTYFRQLLQTHPPILTDQDQREAYPFQISIAEALGYQKIGEVKGSPPLEVWMRSPY
ncbi:MAG: hypothetical protein AAF399_06105 [Bacteroidota bacterium]